MLSSEVSQADKVSIHAPREGCDYVPRARFSAPQTVSIHAPREGCDFFFKFILGLFKPFQFTHPGRGATC